MVQGLSLGFAGSVIPGPYLAFLFSQSVKFGWRHTLPALLAPLITDGPIILLVVVILTQVPVWMLIGLKLVGGLFILFLAYRAFAVSRVESNTNPLNLKTRPRSLINAVTMNFANPAPYLFWSLIGGPILVAGFVESWNVGLAFLVANYFALLTGFGCLIFLFSSARRLKPEVIKTLNFVSSCLLLGLGLFQIAHGLLDISKIL